MKLLILFLIVVIVCVDAQQRPRYCSRFRKCRKTEVCVRTPTSRYWSRFGLGVCKPKKPYVQVKTCSSGSDCGQNECCESTAQLRGRKKRQIGGTSGVCKPLQNSGQSCLTQYSSGKPASTVLQCPCTGELTCISDGGRLFPQGETVPCICRAPVPCRTGADCGPRECCKSRVRPIGRRRRQAAGGLCEPLGAVGDSCLTRYPSGKPDAMEYACPCEKDLKCHGSGMIDIPLGETGTCIA